MDVDTGSNSQDFEGDFIIILSNSATHKLLNYTMELKKKSKIYSTTTYLLHTVHVAKHSKQSATSMTV